MKRILWLVLIIFLAVGLTGCMTTKAPFMPNPEAPFMSNPEGIVELSRRNEDLPHNGGSLLHGSYQIIEVKNKTPTTRSVVTRIHTEVQLLGEGYDEAKDVEVEIEATNPSCVPSSMGKTKIYFGTLKRGEKVTKDIIVEFLADAHCDIKLLEYAYVKFNSIRGRDIFSRDPSVEVTLHPIDT